MWWIERSLGAHMSRATGREDPICEHGQPAGESGAYDPDGLTSPPHFSFYSSFHTKQNSAPSTSNALFNFFLFLGTANLSQPMGALGGGPAAHWGSQGSHARGQITHMFIPTLGAEVQQGLLELQ